MLSSTIMQSFISNQKFYNTQQKKRKSASIVAGYNTRNPILFKR